MDVEGLLDVDVDVVVVLVVPAVDESSGGRPDLRDLDFAFARKVDFAADMDFAGEDDDVGLEGTRAMPPFCSLLLSFLSLFSHHSI